MKLLIVRHGDPNYAIDSLTAKGKREAILLAKRLSGLKNATFYCSVLGRAKKTASYTLKALGATATYFDWLQEFRGSVKDENGKDTCCWDRLPRTWTEEPIYFTKEWYHGALFRETNVEAEYRIVCDGLDALLERHGYRHVGNHFEAFAPNSDTIVLFCHFGVESVLLSHLFGVSPMVFWHNTCALTTSVTTLVTEEREQGYAIFRMLGFSDISHLYAEEEPPSFQARFCERFTDDTRH